MLLPAINNGGYTLKACPITTRPKPSTLPKEIVKELHRLHMLTAREGLAQIDTTCEQYKTHPQVLSLKTYFAVQLKKVRLANRLIQQNHELNPSSITAFINYADMLLRKSKRRQLKLLLNDMFDLVDLFPGEAPFYADDVRAFCIVMGHYFIKEKPKATLYYSNAYKIAPDHPSVVKLECKLNQRSLFNW